MSICAGGEEEAGGRDRGGEKDYVFVKFSWWGERGLCGGDKQEKSRMGRRRTG